MHLSDFTKFIRVGYKLAKGSESIIIERIGIELTEKEQYWFRCALTDALYKMTNTSLTILNDCGSYMFNIDNRCKSLSLTYFPIESHEGKAFLLEDANRNEWLVLLSHATPLEAFNLGK